MKKPGRPKAAPADQGELFGTGAALPASGAKPSRAASPAPSAERPASTPPAPPGGATPSTGSGASPFPGDRQAPSEGPAKEPLAAPITAPTEPSPHAARVPPKARGREVLTVGALTAQLKGVMEGSFPRVWVRGEISGFRGANARGHLYFNLKDAEACLDAKIWASTAQRMKFRLRDGMEVVAEGSIDLYAPQGRYSLIVQRIEPSGEGALALAFQQLKERLTAEGLMGEGRVRPPRPVPFLPRRVGVVTSRTGAALQDFLRVLHQRNPKVSVLLCDARVQGEGAANEVARAIGRLARTDVDVIVVTRGGGSMEDLWTFNEEKVARAIFACPVPVVSAIGHEVDFTISDFVADLRCPTPSAAAERLSPVLRELELGLRTAESRLRKAAERHVMADRQRLSRAAARLGDPRRVIGQRRLALADDDERLERAVRRAWRARREALSGLSERLGRQRPQARLTRDRRALEALRSRMFDAIWKALEGRDQQADRLRLRLARATPSGRIHRERAQLSGLAARLKERERGALLQARHRLGEAAAKLEALSPLKVLGRGYSVVFRADDGRLVRRAEEVRPGELLRIRLAGRAPDSLEGCDEIDARVEAAQPAPPAVPPGTPSRKR